MPYIKTMTIMMNDTRVCLCNVALLFGPGPSILGNCEDMFTVFGVTRLELGREGGRVYFKTTLLFVLLLVVEKKTTEN